MIRIKDVSFWDLAQFDRDKVEKTRRAVGTLVVREEASAIAVATAAEAMKSRVVVVVDNQDKPTGIFVPDEVKIKLRRAKAISVDVLSDVLGELEHDSEEQEREFHHEFLNFARSDLKWCSAGAHYSTDPCPDHTPYTAF